VPPGEGAEVIRRARRLGDDILEEAVRDVVIVAFK
jgi:hypothetical protein